MQPDRVSVDAEEMGGVKKPQAQLLDDQLFQFLHGLLDQVTQTPSPKPVSISFDAQNRHPIV